MTILNRILSISVSSGLIIIILELIRRRKLKEKYALLWLIMGGIILLLGVFDKLLFFITNTLGIAIPLNGVLFFGIFSLMLINLHFSLVISKLSEQNKIIAQKLALFEIDFAKIKPRNNQTIC